MNDDAKKLLLSEVLEAVGDVQEAVGEASVEELKELALLLAQCGSVKAISDRVKIAFANARAAEKAKQQAVAPKGKTKQGDTSTTYTALLVGTKKLIDCLSDLDETVATNSTSKAQEVSSSSITWSPWLTEFIKGTLFVFDAKTLTAAKVLFPKFTDDMSEKMHINKAASNAPTQHQFTNKLENCARLNSDKNLATAADAIKKHTKELEDIFGEALVGESKTAIFARTSTTATTASNSTTVVTKQPTPPTVNDESNTSDTAHSKSKPAPAKRKK
jgi:hypothetical protein